MLDQFRRFVESHIAIVAFVQDNRVPLVMRSLVLHKRRFVLVPRVAFVAEKRQLSSKRFKQLKSLLLNISTHHSLLFERITHRSYSLVCFDLVRVKFRPGLALSEE